MCVGCCVPCLVCGVLLVVGARCLLFVACCLCFCCFVCNSTFVVGCLWFVVGFVDEQRLLGFVLWLLDMLGLLFVVCHV